MLEFENVPGFMIDRAIQSLERIRADIDAEIEALKTEKSGRTIRKQKSRQASRLVAEILKTGETDEQKARIWLMEQGHSWKYSGEILSCWKMTLERQKKAAREVEIFRRWIVGKEKKTDLAREFGLSRATVERICRKMAEDDGLKNMFNLAKGSKKNAPTLL